MHARPRARRPLDPIVFRPPRSLGVIVGGALAAWAFGGALVAGQAATGAEAELKTFLAWAACAVLGVTGLVFANWAYAIFTLAYAIDRNALTIRWGFRRVIVPIDTIQRMVPGRTLDEAKVRGLNWWGCHVGSADVKRIGFALFYSTHNSPDELLFVVTTEESYALTVLDQAAFAEEIQGRAAMGPVGRHSQRATAHGIASFPFWRDRAAMAAATATVIACAAVWGYVYTRYPYLPAVVEINFPSAGGIVRVGDKSHLLQITQASLGIAATNLLLGVVVHSRERAAGLWLLSSGALIQCVLLGAAVLAFYRA